MQVWAYAKKFSKMKRDIKQFSDKLDNATRESSNKEDKLIKITAEK